MTSPVILIVGAVGSGKTTALVNLVSKWRQSGQDAQGILAHRVMEDERVIGYDLEVIGQEKRSVLARKKGTGAEQIGPFVFFDEALARGRQALRESAKSDIVIVDEVGPLELRGGGWAGEVKKLLYESDAALILIVRAGLQEQVVQWLAAFQRPVHSLHLEELDEKRIATILERH